jgi:oligopeptide/dipeptide ABC transporter ATP-binding protein
MTAVLQVEGLTKHFPVKRGLLRRQVGAVQAVSDVSLSVAPGETLAVVGESGCGKSTLGRAILRLHEPDAGTIRLDGADVTALDAGGLRDARRQMQIIFQDPYGSLNPRMTVRETLAEPLLLHGLATSGTIRAEVDRLIELCGLSRWHADRYPHEFSGGQRQRVGIARALATRPRLIICDEPVSALDVSIQAQVINLLIRLQRELNLALVFIAHDLAVVKHISDRVLVMYLGKVMEIASATDLYANPQHPYTQALLSAVPIPDPVLEAQKIVVPLVGDLPSPMNPPSGCVFRTRCPRAQAACAEQVPALIGEDHQVACHFPGPLTEAEIAAVARETRPVVPA